MAQVLVRDLDPKTVAALKRRAARKGRSLQAELKEILETAARIELYDPDKELRHIREMFKGRMFSDSAELIREDRDTR